LAQTLFSLAAVSAIDDQQSIKQVVITVSNVADGDRESLTIGGTNILLKASDGPISLSSGTATVTFANNTATITINGTSRTPKLARCSLASAITMR
jgi:hypothetical protein